MFVVSAFARSPIFLKLQLQKKTLTDVSWSVSGPRSEFTRTEMLQLQGLPGVVLFVYSTVLCDKRSSKLTFSSKAK